MSLAHPYGRLLRRRSNVVENLRFIATSKALLGARKSQKLWLGASSSSIEGKRIHMSFGGGERG